MIGNVVPAIKRGGDGVDGVENDVALIRNEKVNMLPPL